MRFFREYLNLRNVIKNSYLFKHFKSGKSLFNYGVFFPPGYFNSLPLIGYYQRTMEKWNKSKELPCSVRWKTP